MFNTAQLLDSYREASEDRAGVIARGDGALILIVADGVGGRENGGNAATRAVELVRDSVHVANTRELSNERFWERAFLSVDASLSEDATCGETTLVALCLTPKRIVGASVGDSEAWWIDDAGNVRVLTEGGRKPYLGRGVAVPVAFSLPTPRTGILLVATDGLFKYTDAARIARAVTQGADDLETIAPALGDLVRSSSGTLYDDLAILLATPPLTSFTPGHPLGNPQSTRA